jgi:hypothetical protein
MGASSAERVAGFCAELRPLLGWDPGCLKGVLQLAFRALGDVKSASAVASVLGAIIFACGQGGLIAVEYEDAISLRACLSSNAEDLHVATRSLQVTHLIISGGGISAEMLVQLGFCELLSQIWRWVAGVHMLFGSKPGH